jgi:hypothetical protein
MKTLKTIIRFKPSKDVMEAVSCGDIGQACYKAALYFNGTRQDDIVVPAGETTLTIEAPTHIGENPNTVGFLISAFDKDGRQSHATPFEFLVRDHVPPERPKELEIIRILQPLELAPTAAIETHGDRRIPIDLATSKLPQSPDDNNEPKMFNITVMNHPEIKDGAVGTVLGLEPMEQKTVLAIFGRDALKPGVDAKVTGKEYSFSVDDTTASIISPDQDILTLREFAGAALVAAA